jgi:hypothetical protein
MRAVSVCLVRVRDLVAVGRALEVVARERRGSPATDAAAQRQLLRRACASVGPVLDEIGSPLLMTPMRSAISSASSM